ncbi:MAG TPA: hypothetical protein VM243_17550 [Phycisphaerae bacterium]|nr:hypothetical protein [Phycisphaerae bacterium]
MSEVFELAGFTVALEGDEAVCCFAGVDELGNEPPANQEEQIRQALQPGGSLSGKHMVVSLEGIPAVSSRQLSSLVAVFRAVGSEDRIPVRGVRRNVRRLFDMTKMDQFFEY